VVEILRGGGKWRRLYLKREGQLKPEAERQKDHDHIGKYAEESGRGTRQKRTGGIEQTHKMGEK